MIRENQLLITQAKNELIWSLYDVCVSKSCKQDYQQHWQGRIQDLKLGWGGGGGGGGGATASPRVGLKDVGGGGWLGGILLMYFKYDYYSIYIYIYISNTISIFYDFLLHYWIF